MNRQLSRLKKITQKQGVSWMIINGIKMIGLYTYHPLQATVDWENSNYFPFVRNIVHGTWGLKDSIGKKWELTRLLKVNSRFTFYSEIYLYCDVFFSESTLSIPGLFTYRKKVYILTKHPINWKRSISDMNF